MTPTFEEAAPSAGAEALAEVEERLGVELPIDYRAFLDEHNGGYLNPNHGDDGVTVRQLYSAGPTRVDMLKDLETVVGWYSDAAEEEGPPGGLLPVGADDFGNHVCVKVRGDDLGGIYFWDHEVVGDADSVRRLAGGFREFFDALQPNP